MGDPNELEALKAALRGTRGSAGALEAIAARIEAFDPAGDIGDSELGDLHRLSLAHAISAQALRGLVETMLKRRGSGPQEAVTQASGEDEER
jgi:hypothetical protein